MANDLSGLQKILNTDSSSGIRVGTIISKYPNRVMVRSAQGQASITVFGTMGSLGDTVLYKDRQILSIIAAETLTVIDIE